MFVKKGKPLTRSRFAVFVVKHVAILCFNSVPELITPFCVNETQKNDTI